MTLEELKQQRLELIVQRAQGKDIVDNAERQLGQVNYAIQVLESETKPVKD